MSTDLPAELVFDRYIVGPGNRMAAAAARRAAESLGSTYNPLVICGPPGVGKTHLLTAVGHLAREVDPDLLVHLESVEALVDRLTTCIAAGTVDAFRDALAQSRVLLLDGLDDIAGKDRTQEELVGVLDGLASRGALTVVASRRPPGEIEGLDPRLAERLAGGLTVEVSPPDRDTRRGILERALGESGGELSRALVDALAGLPLQSGREVIAALGRVSAARDASDAPLELERLPEILGLAAVEASTEEDEFGAFLSDITTAVAAVVETAPWRRRIAQAILRWEGDGIRTRRLEAALDADSAPDVDALLNGFARDVARLREIQRQAAAPPRDPTLLTDPDRLAEAEALLSAKPDAEPRPQRPARPTAERRAATVDRWFEDREKFAWSWLAIDERLIEEQS